MPEGQRPRELASLDEIRLNNLRAFGSEVCIPIAPVNLIFGNNNAGKSSIFHSLLWIREVLEKGNLNVHRPEVSGNYIDLGGIKNFIHKKSNGELSQKFGFAFKITIPNTQKYEILEKTYEEVLSDIKE
ncbi:hypothetical protein EBS02_07680, partial [bacterium]|nr:hypothetical protein [bacterium]